MNESIYSNQLEESIEYNFAFASLMIELSEDE